MNRYKDPNSSTVGAEGTMFNQATRTEKQIEYNHYGIFANDNTYAITFNPYINRPPTKYMADKPVKPPPSNQHITKPTVEPATSITDGGFYLKNNKTKKPPLLPPYLNKPEELGEIQGRAYEKDKAQIIREPNRKVKFETILY